MDKIQNSLFVVSCPIKRVAVGKPAMLVSPKDTLDWIGEKMI